jgi:peptidoglycan/xylan/chitin deacetylase (PgdA/CDA1 family)
MGLAPRRALLFRGKSGVALTFDDGPDADHTPRYLDLLRDLGVRGTFFVVGENVERHPDLVRRMAAEGHDIGNHGHRHLQARKSSFADFREDLRIASSRLREVVEREIRLYRPPYADLPLIPFLHLLSRGFVTVMWDVDSLDYQRDPRVVRDQLRRHNRWNGHVILLHDDHHSALDVLPELIREGKERRCAFRTVSEMIHGS